MGGTAVAMVLRHRHSHDLDFMTLQPFDSRAVAAKLLSSAARAAYKDDDRPHIAKVAFDGVPVTVMRDLRGFVEGHATQLADPSVVDGIAVGSIPDLMATKLDVIQHRRQGRDYIDIAAMDRAGACTIEDGLPLPQTALRPHRHLRRNPPHRTARHQPTAHRPRPRLRPPPHSGCQPPRRTPARRPRLGATVRAAATAAATRPTRTRTLTRHHGHVEGGFARQHSNPCPLLDHQGRVLPQPAAKACLLDHEPGLARSATATAGAPMQATSC